MRLAVLSDIHANLEALLQVLTDLEQQDIDEIISLGDNIGYGPDPDQVISILRRRDVHCILGNHELAVKSGKYLAWFNPTARKSLLRTIVLLSPPAVDYINGLTTSLVRHDCRFVHGFPPASVTTYLFQVSDGDLAPVFEKLKESICFIGHTHDLALIAYDRNRIWRLAFSEGLRQLNPELQYLVNIGSVGQPRDGNPCAKYVILDTATYTLELRHVAYDRFTTADKIIKAGMPKLYAERLVGGGGI